MWGEMSKRQCDAHRNERIWPVQFPCNIFRFHCFGFVCLCKNVDEKWTEPKMYLVIECTRFNINWVFMFLSSVYLICHCQFLYRMAFVFSSLFLPVHTFFRHKFVFTHTHTQNACIEFRLVAPSTSKMESTTFRFSLCLSLCVCVSIVCWWHSVWGKNLSIIQTQKKRCGLLIYFIIKLCRYRRIILRFPSTVYNINRLAAIYMRMENVVNENYQIRRQRAWRFFVFRRL